MRGRRWVAQAAVAATCCLPAASAAASPAAPPAVRWLLSPSPLAARGAACLEVCRGEGLSCSEDNWPLHPSEWAPIRPAQCAGATTWPGGVPYAPVVLNLSGVTLCLWHGALWGWQPAVGRCAAHAPFGARRLCPCVPAPPGGAAVLWPPGDWNWGDTPAGSARSVHAVGPGRGRDVFFAPQLRGGVAWAARGNAHFLSPGADPQLGRNATVRSAASSDGALAVAWDNGTFHLANLLESPEALPYFDSGFGVSHVRVRPGPLVTDAYDVVTGSPRSSRTGTVDAIILAASVAAVYATRDRLAWLTVSGDVGSRATAPLIWSADGRGAFGGDKQLSAGRSVVAVAATRAAFAMLHRDGGCTAHGDRAAGGLISPEAADRAAPDAVAISATEAAFSLLRVTGEIVAWGHPERGGDVGPRFARGSPRWLCAEGQGWAQITSPAVCDEAAAQLRGGGGPGAGPPDNSSTPGCWLTREDAVWSPGELPPCYMTEDPEQKALGCGYRRLLVDSRRECEAACCAEPQCGAVMWGAPRGNISDCPSASLASCYLFYEDDSTVPQLVAAAAAPQHANSTLVRKGPGVQLCTAARHTAAAIVTPGAVRANGRGATGLYATARSFAAVLHPDLGGGVVVWPPPQSGPVGRATGDVYGLGEAGVVIASEEALAVLLQGGGALLLWADGLSPPPRPRRAPLPRPSPLYLSGVPRAVAATAGAVLAAGHGRGGVSAAAARAPLLDRFVELAYAGCYWTLYQEGVDYEVYYYQHTREECARACLDDPRCTGFEYPSSGEYCGPWLRLACSNASSSGLHRERHNGYELYLMREYVLTLDEDGGGGGAGGGEPQPASDVLGAGPCTAPPLGAGAAEEPPLEPLPSIAEIAGVTVAACLTACIAALRCTGFSFSVPEPWGNPEGDAGAAGRCALHGRAPVSSAGRPGAGFCYRIRRGGGELDAPWAQVGELHVRARRSGMDLLRHGAAGPFDSCRGCENATDLSAATAHVFSPSRNWVDLRLTHAGLDVEFAWTTAAAGPPESDPGAWVLEETAEEAVPFRTLWWGHGGPLQRGARSAWVAIPGHVAGLPRALGRLRFRVLQPRGRGWYHRLAGYGCFWGPGYAEGVDYAVIPGAHTAEQCARVCSTFQHCTGFEFPADGRYCAPWLRGGCSNASSPGWAPQAGYDLYLLAQLPLARQRAAPDPGEEAAAAWKGDVTALAATRRHCAVLGKNRTALLPGGCVLSGVRQLVAGWSGFAALATGAEGFSECAWEMGRGCGAAPAAAPSPCGTGQSCYDTSEASWDAGDYVCSCEAAAGEAVGEAAECEDIGQAGWWPVLLLVLPVHLEALARLLPRRGAAARARRQLELELLRAQIPDFDRRLEAARLLLLWQSRLRRAAAQPTQCLPRDLLLHLQQFAVGALLQFPRRPSGVGLTPLGRLAHWAARRCCPRLAYRPDPSPPPGLPGGPDSPLPELLEPLL
eukprot:TRINITY_DN8382_c0_g1_i1.p1 TRINITY_DN8382_c0_g1~~TRINITY_DN8382_c0_g1_i1.p1  ORF type:complete len:1485 (+),score=352.06 TRINITY_DN8382_c0_g1_i1:73-4455(+)